MGRRALSYAIAKRMAALNRLDLKDSDGMVNIFSCIAASDWVFACIWMKTSICQCMFSSVLHRLTCCTMMILTIVSHLSLCIHRLPSSTQPSTTNTSWWQIWSVWEQTSMGRTTWERPASIWVLRTATLESWRYEHLFLSFYCFKFAQVFSVVHLVFYSPIVGFSSSWESNIKLFF